MGLFSFEGREGVICVRPLSLACRRRLLPSLHMSFPLCVCPNSSNKDTSHKDTSHTGFGPTHGTSFHLDCLFKDPLFEYSHVLGYWG